MAANSPIIWDEGQTAKMLNTGPLMFGNGVTIVPYAGDPNSNVSGSAGSLVLDTVGLKIWRNNGSTNLTEWIPDISIANATNTGVTLTLGSNNTLSAAFTGSNVNHDTLALPNGNSNVQHLTGAQISALHPAVTVSNASNTGVTLTLDTNQGLSGSFTGSNVPHNSLSTISGGSPSNYFHYSYFATVAAAEAGTGIEGSTCYIDEKEMWYSYCSTHNATVDHDLVLSTAAGGTTRWEATQKMTRAHGDNGWISTDNATVSAISSTAVRIALASQGMFAVKGVRIHIPAGNYDHTITGAAGVKYIGFNDDTLVLKQRDDLWDFNAECPVMIAYWSGTAIVFAPQTEFHTAFRNTAWHNYAHLYQGLQYKSGLTFTGNSQTDNNTNPGADDTVTYLWATDGVVQDEDAVATPGIGQWAQTLGSGLTSATAGIFNFAYFNGTIIASLAAMADRSPFIYSGANGPPQWNSGGTLTDSVTGDYIVYHYFATPMTGGFAVFSRPHNAKFSSLSVALTANPGDLTWTSYAEIKHLYTAVFRVNTGWSTTHRCKLVSLRSFRLTAGTPAAGTAATDHNALSNRAVPGAHPGVAVSLDTSLFGGILGTNETSVQTAMDKIDDIFAGTLSFTSSNATHTILSTNVSTTSTNGALVITGGMGIGGAINAGGIILGSNLSGTNTGNETTTTMGTLVNGASNKATPVDADKFPVVDTQASNVLKETTWANIKTALATTFVTSATASVKCVVVTGTTANSDSYVDVNHSISGTIVSAFCVVDNGSGAYLCHGYTSSANLEFNFFVDGTKVRVVNKASNSTDIRSKTFKCVIFYT